MDVSKYYEVRGVGSPILFIHGSYASTSTWRKMVDQLSGQHQCILFKLPGHCGLPDPTDFDMPTMNTELALINQVVAEVVREPLHVVGHSYGGVVALALALQGRVELRKLTLFEPVATWVLEIVDQPALLAKVADFLVQYRESIRQGVPKAGGRVIDFWCNSAEFQKIPSAVQEQLLLLQQNNLRHWDLCTKVSHSQQDITRITVPASLVVGSESVDVAHGIVDVLQGLMPAAKKTVIPGANHLLVTTHSDACFVAM